MGNASRRDQQAAVTDDVPAKTKVTTAPVPANPVVPAVTPNVPPSAPTPPTAVIHNVPHAESSRQLEQQQAKITQLENEVAAVQERLKKERMENEARSAVERQAANAARQAQQRKIEELQNSAAIETVSTPIKVPAQQAVESNPQPTGSVQTVSVTTDREQTLYRSAVTAYKVGDCTESIKTFDALTKSYPNSPFASDAAFYRKDCYERLAESNK
jgi:TolA-binding protein